MIPATPITDGIVTLRPLQMDDAAAMYAAVRESLAELTPWMSWAHEGYEEREAREWIRVARERWEDNAYFGFTITDAGDGAFLGGCSLSHIHPIYRFCNLGYWVRTSRRGRGIAGQAARLAARFAFEKLGLVRVEIVIAAGNEVSCRVAEKIGAHREGILRNRMIVHNTIYDAAMYSLLPSDLGLAARL